MKREHRHLWIGAVFGLLLLGTPAAYADELSPGGQSPLSGGSSMTGTIDRITEDEIVLETEQGLRQSFSLEGVEDAEEFKEGDQVTLQVGDDNRVMSIDKAPGADSGLEQDKRGLSPGGTVPGGTVPGGTAPGGTLP